MAYWGGKKWRKCGRASKRHSSQAGEIKNVGERWRRQGIEAEAELDPLEICVTFREGCGGASTLAETGAQDWVFQRDGRWVSGAFKDLRERKYGGCRAGIIGIGSRV